MNYFVIGLILFLTIIGLLSILYITNKSTSDCTQKDGTADHVTQYKYDEKLHTCVPSICEDGYGPIQDGKCFDCSSKDGTDNVKTYVYDKTQDRCIIRECEPGFIGDDCKTKTLCVPKSLTPCTCTTGETYPATYTLCSDDGSTETVCGVPDGSSIISCDAYCTPEKQKRGTC